MPAPACQSSKWFNTNFYHNLINFRCRLHNLKTANDIQLIRNKSSVRFLKCKMDKDKRELNPKCSNSSPSQASSSRRNRSNNIACVRQTNPRNHMNVQQTRSSSFVMNPFARHYENANFFNSWQNQSLLVPLTPTPVLQRTYSDSFVVQQRCANVRLNRNDNFNWNCHSRTNEFHASKNKQNGKFL